MEGFNRKDFSASKAIVVLASGLLMGLFVVAFISQLLCSIAGLDQLNLMRVATALQNVIMFMLPAVAVGVLFGGGKPMQFMRLSKAPSLKAVVGILVIYVVMTPAMDWLVAWNESITLPESLRGIEEWMRQQEETAQAATNMLLSGTSVADLLITVVSVGVLTGLGEEMFFRGALQRICIDGMRRRHLAVWTAAFVFSALHFQFFGFVPRLMLGVFFGYAYLWSGSLWVPVIGHALNNSMVVAATWMNGGNVSDNAAVNPWLAAVSAVATVALLYAYRRILTAKPSDNGQH